MWKKLRRPLLSILAIQAIALIVAQIVASRWSKGDERSDEFKIAAICGGKKFQSRAEHLRSGAVVASMGGIDLDLRDATLDPAGATIDLNATMGGVQITVPEAWAVDIDKSALAGGVEAKVTAREDLPDDAPSLHIRAVVRMGGALVTTGVDD